MNDRKKLIVVGGGASGMAAALAAAEAGAAVTVLERLDRVGKKLLATGNGRCNLTNRSAAPEHYHTAEPERLAAMLRRTPPDAVLDFFAGNGLLCTEEAEGRVYPRTRQASTVLDILRAALTRAGTAVECGCGVIKIERKADGFTLTAQNGRRFSAGRVVLAAGGRAAPQFGTDGAGFALAQSLGHTVRAPYPCLVPLRCRDFPGGLKGVRAYGALSLWRGEKCVGKERGEIQFTEYGLSGIPAMQLSCLLAPGGGEAVVSVDLFPDLTFEALRAMLAARRGADLFATLESFLLGLAAKPLALAALKDMCLSPLSRGVRTLTDRELSTLTAVLKGRRYAVEGTLSWAHAQTTGGGVPLSEVDEETCESRKCPGLFLTGELLDAAGDCGGYNLQWAWATGLAAGKAAAR